ncbi:MAG: tetraacyldisaccharide 4'-kinase [Bacteroidia bacterium]|nr:tetraacyldisaccharide 4'-kinase [Bacteroidia bacterium]
MQHHSTFINLALSPFALLYGVITSLRNKLYDWQVLNSYAPTPPCIVVGNLSVGGTGKSPMIEYLIQFCIDNHKTVTTISRGYGRSNRGYKEVQLNDTAQNVGDEPLQFKQQFGNLCTVIVDEKRVHALHLLQPKETKNTVYLLDDALQHRAVKGSMNILLTNYSHLYIDDAMLPKGNLRENKNSSKRAQIIIVTKCPAHLTITDENIIKKRLNVLAHQQLFFSTIQYHSLIRIGKTATTLILTKSTNVISFAGIANDALFVTYLNQQANVVQHFSFPDHYAYTPADIDAITNAVNEQIPLKTIVVTTHKDAMRLLQNYISFINEIEVYYLPTKMYFSPNEQQKFNQILLQHVSTN